MTNLLITSTQFIEYLESLGLFRITLTVNETGAEALLSKSTPANLRNFTQVYTDSDGFQHVRLSKSDYFNDAITRGFFTAKACES